jgi:hypothetical protein
MEAWVEAPNAMARQNGSNEDRNRFMVITLSLTVFFF